MFDLGFQALENFILSHFINKLVFLEESCE
jgi:hypothetical protein